MAELKTAKITVGDLGENCWFLVREDTKEALVFDPGDQAEDILAYAEKNGWKIRAILLTHGHVDHIGAVEAVKAASGAPVYALREEAELLADTKKNLSAFLFGPRISLTADELLRDGQKIAPAGIGLVVYHTPGHTPGGACYYCPQIGCLFSGDTLFQGSVGRSDFPGGSASALVRAVKEKLFLLPDDTRVCPGHGGDTTIGEEKQYNPFVV
ncbi:MAG: MBL fold metallo-hydrolase [Eubacteriales bacterium]|nr:MBL fold metallo-hydrolase [Eubacteriales bacterium]